ncbi:MAG: response regulator [Clostridiales bacterium]|nr:response regulator [Clostridiales bacterium]
MTSSPVETPFKVLVVDDAPAVRETVKKMLELYPEFQVVGEAADGPEAVAACQTLQPDVVVMDVNLPTVDGIRATAEIVKRSGAAVVMISVEGETEYLRRAMKAGAKDYLVKPFSPDGLAEALRRAAGDRALLERRGTLGKGVAVVGARGGVGASTLALYLALSAGSPEKPSYLVDGDLELGGLELLLDVEPLLTWDEAVQKGWTRQPEKIREGLVEGGEGRVKFLGAPPLPHLADLVDGPQRPEAGRAYVRETLESLYSLGGPVVIDAGRGFREGQLQALEAAQEVVVVTTPGVHAVAAARKVLLVLEEGLGKTGEDLAVAVNRYDPNQPPPWSELEEALGRPVRLRLPVEPLLPVAADEGKPLLLQQRKSRWLEAVEAFAAQTFAEGGDGPEKPRRFLPWRKGGR